MSALEDFEVVALQPGSVERHLPVFAAREGAVQLRERAPGTTRTDVSEAVFVLHDVLHAGECEAIVAMSGRMGYHEDAPVSLGRSVRHNQNCVWIQGDAINDEVFRRCEHLLPEYIELFTKDETCVRIGPAAGLNRRWRLYQYTQGDYFKWHQDGGWTGSGLDADGELVDDLYGGRRFSWLTFLIYLNDDFEGGRTLFQGPGDETFAVTPARGSVLVFFHGYHPLSQLHMGEEVTRGVKYVARTDVLFEMPEGT